MGKPLLDAWAHEFGQCDVCEMPYVLGDIEDHCVEEGTCWEHCNNEEQDRARQLEVLGGMLR